MAMAGGVNLILSPDAAISLSKWGFMAADGRCKTFDAAADGFVRGEGCGVVVLKRLADALADGDPSGGDSRHGGEPGRPQQRADGAERPGAGERDSRGASRRHARSVVRVDYVEAHGTGTRSAIRSRSTRSAEVYGAAATDRAAAVGSVKTNIGHLEAAAGVAGLIKVVLALQHEQIPPHLHFTSLNPHASLDGTRLRGRRPSRSRGRRPTGRDSPASARSASAAPMRT